MNTQIYLEQLGQALNSLQAAQRDAILSTVKADCEQKIAGGMPEQDVISSLPAPEILAKRKILELSYRGLKADFSLPGLARWALALGGLAMANFALFVPAITWLSILFAGFISALMMYGSGVMLTASAVSGNQQFKLDLPAHMLQLGDHDDGRSEVRHGQIIAGGSEIAVVAATSVPAQPAAENAQSDGATKLEFTFRQSVMPRISSGVFLIILSFLTAWCMTKLSALSWRGLVAYLRWNRKVLQSV